MFLDAQRKDLALVKRAIEQGAPVDARDPQGYTALIHACGLSQGIDASVDLARYLLAQGAEVNAKAERGFTPLTEACAYGAFEVARLLLESGADPNLKGEGDIPPLTFGATCSHRPEGAPAIVELLLKKGADVNARDGSGYDTLLKLVSGTGCRLDVARLLIDAGADLAHVGPYETTALKGAAEKGQLEMVKLLVAAGADVNQELGGESALASAIRKNHKDVVVCLLEAGAETRQGEALSEDSLLAYAGAHGHVDLLRFVSFTNLSHEDAREALVQAARTGQLELMKELVQRGIRLDMDHADSEDPLMLASRYGRLETARYLLENHASLEARDEKGNTPLLFAAHDGRLEMLSFLLDKGADLHARNELGWTALFQACARGHDRCVSYLIQRGADIDAIEEEQGATSLIIAASRGRLPVVKLLLDAGAKTDLHAKNGRTALTWAKGKDEPEIVELLRQRGAALPVLPAPAPGAAACCGYCEAPLSIETSETNFCPPCNVPYCDRHYPWSDWQHEHFSADDMVRSAMCPQGHPRVEHRGPD